MEEDTAPEYVPTRRVTSFDVADHAGVSQSTVSRALSGSAVITEATRQRVLEAARELGYFVDERAARLRRGHSGTLAVVVIQRPRDTAGTINPFYYTLLGSVCEAASARGFETLVSFQRKPEQFFSHYVERGQAEGMLVMGSSSNREAWEFFRENDRGDGRAAYWGSPFDQLGWVRSDNHLGGALAAERLLERGCKRLAFLGSETSHQAQFAERCEGFRAKASEAGMDISVIEIDERMNREDQGAHAVARYLDANGEEALPDGIFAACDSLALGALDLLAERDIAVPERTAMIGFDGVSAGLHSHPPLTTIAPDFASAGKALIDTVLSHDDPARTRRVPVELIARSSG